MLFLKDYASYIKDSMFSELTELNRNLMLSIDVIPIPTDEAVREVERLLLGVETNITGWQRRQNQNNNFQLHLRHLLAPFPFWRPVVPFSVALLRAFHSR